MKKKVHETIIIGAGISGLACARKLHENGKEFLIISEDIGGRILTSEDGKVNYGASYMTEDYRNAMRYIDKGNPLRSWNCSFLVGNRCSSLFCWQTLLQLPSLLKFTFFLLDFRMRLRRLRKRACHQPQKIALAADPVLKQYVEQPAIEFVKRHRLEFLHKNFINPVAHSTFFVDAEKTNVFCYLTTLQNFICKNYTMDFRQIIPHLTQGWQNKIILSTAQSISKNDNEIYRITTSQGEYFAQNVVIAIPYKDAEKLYPLHQTVTTIPIYTLHVSGKRKGIFKNKKIVFFRPEYHDITIIWQQPDGTDIIFSFVSNPKLKEYYDNNRIIKKTYWKTAVMLPGSEWVDQELGDGLYLASDYNISSVEDAFITGVYAANQIIKR